MPFRPKRLPIHTIPSLRYGLNTQQGAEEIGDLEMSDCENFTVEEDTISLAGGYVTWDDTPRMGPYYGGIAFVKSDGTLVDIRQRQGKLEYAPDGDSLWTECTLPTTGSPAANIPLTQKPCTFAILNDVCFWANGEEDVMTSTDGITWTAQPTLPKAAVVFNNGYNRILFLKQPAAPYRLDWSAINDGLTVDAAAYQLVDPNSHGYLLGAGLTPSGDLVLFKDSGLYSVSQFVDDGIIDINFIGDIIFTCQQTVATTEDSIIWGSYNGAQEYIGGRIRQIMGRINPAGRNDTNLQELYCGIYYNNKYRFSRPDATIDDGAYNSQEYIIHKKLRRNDAVQPYVVTRNKRYVGCYFIENFTFDGYGFDNTLYMGDSRSDGDVFAWVNDYKTTESPFYEVQQMLGGEAQTAYFVTKYFTDNTPFFIKRFKKFFADIGVEQDLTVTMSYRFLPYGPWNDVAESLASGSLDWDYDGGGSGSFSEGYSFFIQTAGRVFFDIENAEKPRGIQFKIAITTLNDVKFYSLAYQYREKPKFK